MTPFDGPVVPDVKMIVAAPYRTVEYASGLNPCSSTYFVTVKLSAQRTTTTKAAPASRGESGRSAGDDGGNKRAIAAMSGRAAWRCRHRRH